MLSKLNIFEIRKDALIAVKDNANIFSFWLVYYILPIIIASFLHYIKYDVDTKLFGNLISGISLFAGLLFSIIFIVSNNLNTRREQLQTKNEEDIRYIETYKKSGGIFNCAGDGRCGYTTRPELAYAYARMLIQDKHNAQTYNLHGEAITQYQLAEYLNRAFGTDLIYTPVTVEEYRKERIAELGEFLGTVIAGIYQGIQEGKADNPSHYFDAAGREHESWQTYFSNIQSKE